jgi:hypothetical protein
VAVDQARVIEVGTTVEVPFGSFQDVLVTEDFTALEPDVLDHKYYAPGIGLVRDVAVAGGKGELVLVDVK